MDSRNIEHWFNNREISVTDEPLILDAIAESINSIVSGGKDCAMTMEQIQAGKYLALGAGSGDAERHLAERLGIPIVQITMVDQQRINSKQGEQRITSDLFAFLEDPIALGGWN
jgi:hypothetical protein